MEESIQQELFKILNDLERISDLVARKEAELGLVRSFSVTPHAPDCYELKFDDQLFYLDNTQLAELKAQLDQFS